ncbi:MAG: HAMP domain-containing histidine kinase [Oscillospiraceae bacterium]|nr:HAMP domain-containing histidine kinase [Oscillospiraceae bacterium]
MRSGLFKQYFTIFFITLLCCTGLLGLTLLTFSGANYTAQRQELLMSAAQRVSDAIVQADTPLGRQELAEMLDGVETLTGVSVFVADEAGTIVMCCEEQCHHGESISQRTVEYIKRDSRYFSAGYFSGFFLGKGDYLFGTALQSNSMGLGYVFASVSIRPLFAYLGDTLFTYLFSAGVMLLVAFVVIYTATLRLTMPLQQMSKAAADFAKGDFSVRVEVEGEDEIARLARNFNSMAEALDEHETSRRSFVASVSHDLRTPMTTIGGYIDGILDGTIPPDRQQEYLSVVSQEVKRLSRLTSSLLSVMRLEEHKTDTAELVSVNTWELVLNIMFNMEQRIEEKRIRVPDFEPDDAWVKADKDMLHQVVYNLLDNAVKYTPVGGEMRVNITPQGDKTEISIYNTGKGISPEEQPYIFERFYKTDKSRGIDRSGTGLGLYIVKMLVGGMDGSVRVSSDGESYTEFIVTLQSAPVPVDFIARERRQAEEKAERAAAAKRGWFRMPWNAKGKNGKNGQKSLPAAPPKQRQ